MSSFAFLFVPTVIFMVVVLPLWLVLHYAGKWRSNRGLSAEDRETLELAGAEIHRLEERVETLETILDAERPDWRARHDR